MVVGPGFNGCWQTVATGPSLGRRPIAFGKQRCSGKWGGGKKQRTKHREEQNKRLLLTVKRKYGAQTDCCLTLFLYLCRLPAGVPLQRDPNSKSRQFPTIRHKRGTFQEDATIMTKEFFLSSVPKGQKSLPAELLFREDTSRPAKPQLTK